MLVGTITVLAVTTAVFLSYQANNGLPFVPTYRISVTLPDAQEMGPGDQVFVAGRLVGRIDSTEASYSHGHPVAILNLKLDQDLADEVHSDATYAVRPASLLGLKYIDLNPGRRGPPVPAGTTLSVSHAVHTVELDQVVSSLDEPTRPDLQRTLVGLADGVASRGPDINEALDQLRPFLRDVSPVLATIARPSTDLGGLVHNLAAVTAELAPASEELAAILSDGETTLAALNAAGPALDATLERLPGAIGSGTAALRTLRPVLAKARSLTARFAPASDLLPSTTRRLYAALETGLPVLRRVVPLGERLKASLASLGSLVNDTPVARVLGRLARSLPTAREGLDYLTPYQTVCNYLTIGLENVASLSSEGNAGGNWLRVEPIFQPSEMLPHSSPAPQLHYNPYPNGAAPGQPRECEAGNEPYLPGRHIGPGPGDQGIHTRTTDPQSVVEATNPP
jgi:virulence factor Mce-like protein